MQKSLFAEAEDRHDPGGKVKTRLDGTIRQSRAEFSKDGCYRHSLWRSWEPDDYSRGAAIPYAMFIGMNPSTADQEFNDPTVTREIGFSRSWGHLAYYKFNVMDYRATYPKDLLAPGVNPCSEVNFEKILEAARYAARIVVCYGVVHAKLQHFPNQLVTALRLHGHELFCFGRTKDGHPKHPLYLRQDSKLEKF
jgi:hypothetical protein